MTNQINNLQGGRSVTPVTPSINPNIGTPPVNFLNEISKKIFAKKSARLIALDAGGKTYYGIKCLHGHDGKRYTRNRACVECRKIEKDKYVFNRRSTRICKKVGRPRKYPELIGPPKPTRKLFKPVTVQEKWIARSKGNKKGKYRRELSVDYYKTLLVTHCPLLEIELSYDLYDNNVTPENYATLDKIDPKKGYVVGNVQIVSYRANTLKNSATLDELKLIVKNWKSNV